MRVIRDRWPEMPVVMLSLLADAETAVEAIKDLGAFYYLTKPPKLKKLREVVAAAVNTGQTRKALPVGSAGTVPGDESQFGVLIGNSPAIRDIYHRILSDSGSIQAQDLVAEYITTPADGILPDGTILDGGSVDLGELKNTYADGTAEEMSLVEFRNRHGEDDLREIIRWAIFEKSDVRAAGEFLGFISASDSSDRDYDNFRQWMSKLGLKKKDVLGR